MNDCLSHRGPDDQGTWAHVNENLVLGHRRLSIIDLTPAGHQPMHGPGGRVIVFNGEIYNYKELRKRLPGESFKSNSDTEVLLTLYARYGKECLSMLNGLFAFCIWDQPRESLFLARDRAGKKPLYYHVADGKFAFSSEIKALLQLPWIKPELDEEALYHFLTFNHLPPPFTMFRNIRKLPEANWCEVDRNGAIRTGMYWKVEYRDLAGRSEKDLAKDLYQQLEASVDLRMVSDVPVGAFLSGGVDSSAVVGLMARQKSYRVKTYSIGFENAPGYDELPHARKVAEKFGTEHIEQVVTADDIRNFLPTVVNIFDEPLADTTAIPIYFISKLAREHGTIVVLTGDGPDELLLGYRNWRRYVHGHARYRMYLNLPAFIRKAAATLAGFRPSPLSEILWRAARGQELFWGGAKSFKENAKRNFLSPGLLERTAGLNSHDIIMDYKHQFLRDSAGSGKRDYGDWMSYLGFRFLHPNRYLFRSDRLGMAHGVEARMPFLDYNFVNTALSIPTSYKVRDNEPKYILKKALEPLLGKEIIYRRKQGFNVPIREWGGDIMLDYISSQADSFCRKWDVFDKRGIERQLTLTKSGNKRFMNNLWTVYFLMSWFEKWMDDGKG